MAWEAEGFPLRALNFPALLTQTLTLLEDTPPLQRRGHGVGISLGDARAFFATARLLCAMPTSSSQAETP